MIKEISLLKGIPIANTYYLNITVRKGDTKMMIKKENTGEKGLYPDSDLRDPHQKLSSLVFWPPNPSGLNIQLLHHHCYQKLPRACTYTVYKHSPACAHNFPSVQRKLYQPVI